MSNVVKKMLNHVPEGLMWHNIFLPAILAILPLHNSATVQAIFFFALRRMRHGKIFLKISTNKIQAPAVFTLLNNSGNFDDQYNITHMKFLLTGCFLSIASLINAQYYYNDIIGSRETNRQMASYVANKVKTVSATGFDQRGAKATGFSEFHEVKENGTALKISSIADLNKTVTYSRFDKQGRVIRIADSSTVVDNTTSYEYDAKGNISKVQNTVTDSASQFNHTEIHLWAYTPDGTPEKMWRIINNADNSGHDTLEIRFTKDEDGNIGEERTFRKGIETGYLYYYYDDKNRLSDIVRYNTRLKKLMPDIMFEYDETDRVIQKITTTSSQSLGYLIWRYIYDSKGLKTKEALFNGDKQLTGKIEYNYSFLP